MTPIVNLFLAALLAAAGVTGVVECSTGKATHPGRTLWGSAVCIGLAIVLTGLALRIWS